MEFNIAPVELSVPVMSKVTSEAGKAYIGLPVGIISIHASSLHSYGAVTTFELVNVQLLSAENSAVKDISFPLAGNITPVKVYGEVSPDTETDAVPSPDNSNVPVPGTVLNVTVISAVKVSSVISDGVPLSLHVDTLLDEILIKLQHASSSVIGLLDIPIQVGID